MVNWTLSNKEVSFQLSTNLNSAWVSTASSSQTCVNGCKLLTGTQSNSKLSPHTNLSYSNWKSMKCLNVPTMLLRRCSLTWCVILIVSGGFSLRLNYYRCLILWLRISRIKLWVSMDGKDVELYGDGSC